MASKNALNCSDFLCFSLKYSILFFGKSVEEFQEGNGLHLELLSPEIFQLAGVGGEVEPQPVAPQGLVLVGQALVLLQRAVFGVAHQGMTGLRHLDTDLMKPPCYQLHFHKCSSLRAFAKFPVKQRCFDRLFC